MTDAGAANVLGFSLESLVRQWRASCSALGDGYGTGITGLYPERKSELPHQERSRLVL